MDSFGLRKLIRIAVPVTRAADLSRFVLSPSVSICIAPLSLSVCQARKSR